MRSFPVICAATFLLTWASPSGFAAAAEPQPTGEWLTENGLAHIRIDNCDGALWGIISWEKEPGGTDSNNPNPAERNRPLLGSHVLLAMKPTPQGRWEGEVYNAENGKTYDANISLTSPDVLRIQGCVLGFLCGGENWTRVKAEDAPGQRPPAGRPGGKPALSACTGVQRGKK
jgi:uncharacterized protein (DUF2147 family)